MRRQNRNSRRRTVGSFGHPKRQFVVFCEGRNTEPRYLYAIRRVYDNAVLVVHPGVGVPYTVAREAVAHLKSQGSRSGRRRGRSAFETGDEV